MALNTAIRHLTRGDWQKAHAIVQNDDSDLGYWAHGIVHMLEGDIGNARYWYRRAGRPFPRERDANAEIDALVTTLKARTADAARATPSKPEDGTAPSVQPLRKAARAAASPAQQQVASVPRTTTKQQR